jgi:hypothetical protein
MGSPLKWYSVEARNDVRDRLTGCGGNPLTGEVDFFSSNVIRKQDKGTRFYIGSHFRSGAYQIRAKKDNRGRLENNRPDHRLFLPPQKWQNNGKTV